MRKLVVLFACVGLAASAIMSCGGKKEETKTEEDDGYGAYETAEPKKLSPEEMIKQGETLTNASDCKTCHHLTNQLVGPSHTDVAKKYDFTKDNVSMLASKIIQGGQGNWGEIPMTAHPDISQADAEKMAMYVLSLDGEKPQF